MSKTGWTKKVATKSSGIGVFSSLDPSSNSTKASTKATKTFKMHDDQKETIEAAIEKAKEKSSTTVDTVALEYICMEFLSGKQVSLQQQVAGLDRVATLSLMHQLFRKVGFATTVNHVAQSFPAVNVKLEMRVEIAEHLLKTS